VHPQEKAQLLLGQLPAACARSSSVWRRIPMSKCILTIYRMSFFR